MIIRLVFLFIADIFNGANALSTYVVARKYAKYQTMK